MKKQKINIVTLGCSKNIVDSEHLAAQLKSDQNKILFDSNKRAETVIINTCGFIGDAKEESINTILQYVKAKEKGTIKQLFVTGCLSQRYKDDLKKEIPEVDQYFGVESTKEIVERLQNQYKTELIGERKLSTPKHFAYLKISEGCDRNCAFCAIPLIRGKHKSMTMEEILKEANNLINQGTKELILIAQDLSYYGLDLYKKQMLTPLIQELVKIDKLKWIRLHYTYPTLFPDDLLDLINKEEKICNYLDIPMQHISDKVLKKMHRAHNMEQTKTLIHKIKQTNPNIALRTTLMVGHPGEGEKEFAELLEFVQESKFDRLGVFTYSEEEGTYGAKNYDDIISQKTKDARAAQIMELQESISLNNNKQKIGKTLEIVIDREERNYFIARSQHDSPEVDNEILIEKRNKKLKIGKFYQAKIISAIAFDLYAEII